jgi:hypothetical protein
MTPNIDANRAHQETSAAYLELKAHAKSPQYEAAVKWIDALLVQAHAYMADCAPANLPAAQIRLKQLRAMRSALVDPGGASTGFVFD